ncbi:hypothetical protein GWI33_017149 [Rhynchophorus ferrugineus]|uniref:Uncharacterized protein n=1 Tax=Rhynchophorus ferrugineus TaxID=354439 RepID=A0A834HX94_RHYFE|nr:hypothetical protein GWI33_017149 [Rhynchophorus ferrugineus]
MSRSCDPPTTTAHSTLRIVRCVFGDGPSRCDWGNDVAPPPPDKELASEYQLINRQPRQRTVDRRTGAGTKQANVNRRFLLSAFFPLFEEITGKFQSIASTILCKLYFRKWIYFIHYGEQSIL